MSGIIPKRVQFARRNMYNEKDQTPNHQGMVPRIGKSGKHIRLYYARVNELTMGFSCKPANPVGILRRGIFVGDVVTNPWNTTARIQACSNLTPSSPYFDHRSRNIYYVLVFNKSLTSPVAVDPAVGETLRLLTPTDVNWGTATLSNPNGGQASSTALYNVTIPHDKFKILDFGVTDNQNMGKVTSPWNIGMEGQASGNFGSGTIPDSETGFAWKGNAVNFSSAPPGVLGNSLNIGLSNTNDNDMSANNGAMIYLVNDESIFGGCALVFNITRLVLGHWTNSTATPPPETTYDGFIVGGLTFVNGWRSSVGGSLWYQNNPGPNTKNNISTTYNPSLGTNAELYSENTCGFISPISGFSLNSGSSATLPLQLIEDNSFATS